MHFGIATITVRLVILLILLNLGNIQYVEFIVLTRIFGMDVSSRRRRRVFCMATAVTIALSIVIICLTSQALGQNDLNEDDNALNGGGARGSIAGGRARIARLKRLRLRPELTTTSAPVRERTRVRVKAIKSRKQKVNADRRATLAQSNSKSGSASSSSDDTNNSNTFENFKDAGNNGMLIL